MRSCLFEDAAVAALTPLTLTRPAFALWCGTRPLAERQWSAFPASERGALVRPSLRALCQSVDPELIVNDADWLRGGTLVLVNARWLPPAAPVASGSAPRIGLVGAQVAFAVVDPEHLGDLLPERIDGAVEDWKRSLPAVAAGGSMIDYPWDLIERNAAALSEDVARFGPRSGSSASTRGPMVVGSPDRLLVAPGAQIEPCVVADTTRGPVIIDAGAVVQAFSRLEGPCYIGRGSWVLGARIRGSTIGPDCRVGGEVEASILHGLCNKYHDGFLGHSYLGEWVNLAAGTQVSDLRNDYRTVVMPVAGERVDTHLTKVGAFVGDHTKTGLGTWLNTGALIGAFCNLLASGTLLPRIIPSFCRYARGQLQAQADCRALLTTAATVMQRRGQAMTDAQATFYQALFDETAAQRAALLSAAGTSV